MAGLRGRSQALRRDRGRDGRKGRHVGAGTRRDPAQDGCPPGRLRDPYLDEIQKRIAANFAAEGFETAAERHLRDRGNFSFSEYPEERIAGLVREVAAAKPDAITVFCTNMRGGPIVEALERETGIPIYDTVATAVWDGLRKVGVKPSRVAGWGRLFREVE